MEVRSEVELMVVLGMGFPRHSSDGSAFEMALKRFEFEFPTMEARRAYVEAFHRHWKGEPAGSQDEGVRAAFRFWFEYIWPNLPRIRSHPRFQEFRLSQAPPLYRTGHIVVHRHHRYRGVIVSIDRLYRGTDQWYEVHAKSLPPKNRPWYRILVDNSDRVTYVAERHIELEAEPRPVRHPLVEEFFGEFSESGYRPQWRRDDPH